MKEEEDAVENPQREKLKMEWDDFSIELKELQLLERESEWDSGCGFQLIYSNE